MKTIFRPTLSFAMIMGLAFVLMAPQADAANQTIASGKLNGKTATMTASVEGLAQVCMRGPGNAFNANPQVSVWVDGKEVGSGSLSPGKCLTVHTGSKGTKEIKVTTARGLVLGTYYFDLKKGSL